MRLLPVLVCLCAALVLALAAPQQPLNYGQETEAAAFSDFTATEDDLQGSETISKLTAFLPPHHRPNRPNRPHRPHYVIYHVPHGHGGHGQGHGGHGGHGGGGWGGGWSGGGGGGHGGWGGGGSAGWGGGHGGWGGGTGGGSGGGWGGGWRGWRRRPGYVVVLQRPVSYGWGAGGHQSQYWGEEEYPTHQLHGTSTEYQQQYTEYPQQNQEYEMQEQEHGGDEMYSE